jgi:formylmethanofuran dehydrogenase subunit B
MPLETKNRVTCTGCALLCDDIAIDTQFGTIQAVHNACLRGSKKFLPAGTKQLLKSPSVDGKEASYDDALAEAALILKAAKKVVIAGGIHGTSEAIEQLVSLATKLGAKLAIPDFDAHTQLTNAIKNNGIEFFTLGEAVNNADVIVFWGANPIDLAPKLLVRTVFSRGRYRQSGKEVKKLAVIDDFPTPTMERADIKVLVDDQDHEGVLKALSAALVGQNATGLPTSDLAEAIKNCEYCTFFVGEGILNRQFLQDHPGFLDRLMQFVRTLNGKRRAAILPLFYSWNAVGIFYELASASEKIDCFDVQDLSSRVKKGDAIVAFGFDLVARCAGNAVVKVDDIPIIAIDFKRTPTTDLARVVLPPTIPGIDSGGVATRLDGTAVLLHPPLQRAEGKKADEDILRELHERV